METVPIGSAFQINPRVKIKRGTKVPFISMDRIKPGQRGVTATETRAFSSGSKFEAGDTLMARITPCLENGKIARYLPKDEAGAAAGSTEFIVLRGHPRLTITEFAYYFAIDPNIHDLSVSLMTGTSGRQRVDVGAFCDTEVAIPDLDTQRSIVAVLGALDDKIAANKEVMRLTDATIQSIWRKLTYEEFSFVEFGDVVQVNPRTTAPKGSRLTTIEMKNLPESGFSIDTWEDREAKGGSRYRNGDTLLARITPCFENGKCGYVDFLEPDEVGSGSTEFIVLRPQPGIPSAAPYAIARSSEFRAFAEQTMTGTSGRQRVQARELEAYEIAWPSSDLLSDFGSKTSPLLDLAGNLRDENLTLAKTRDELLPLLMGGKITVKEAEQEAAVAGANIASEENEA